MIQCLKTRFDDGQNSVIQLAMSPVPSIMLGFAKSAWVTMMMDSWRAAGFEWLGKIQTTELSSWCTSWPPDHQELEIELSR